MRNHGLQASHDDVLGRDAMGVTLVLEGLLEDDIVISIIGNHYILIPQAGLDREMSSVIFVELADGVDAIEDFVGRTYICQG
jgi:hypothetical protein